MPHLIGAGWSDLRPALGCGLPVWLTRDARAGWLAVEHPDAATGGPIHCRMHLAKGTVVVRLGLRGRVPRALAGLALPAVSAALASCGLAWTGGTVPHPRPWGWGAERPRSRILEPPPPTGAGLEIGFGSGERLVDASASGPWWGVEASRVSVDKAARRVAEGSSVLHGAAGLFLPFLPDASFSVVLALFPDPWPKERHAERRWLAGPALRHLARVLEPGGWLGVATDHPDMAAHLDSALPGAAGFTPGDPDPAEFGLSRSKYAAKARAEGREARLWRLDRDGSTPGADEVSLPVAPSPFAPPSDPAAIAASMGLEARGDWGVLRIVEAAAGPAGQLLHVVHSGPDGEAQDFLVTHGKSGWDWDRFTMPLVTPDLLRALSDLAAASGSGRG